LLLRHLHASARSVQLVLQCSGALGLAAQTSILGLQTTHLSTAAAAAAAAAGAIFVIVMLVIIRDRRP
jgi:hypothetical protein